ncbi:MAG: efflux RND transporter permease subunit [Pseudomonadales bacterium]
MWLSDTSVQRPVFATVISLLLVAFGLLAFNALPLREYPDISSPVVSVRTAYVGASADVIETRITQIIEDQISGIEGIKNIRSTSQDEFSNVNIEFALSRDIDQAANDVRDRVSRILGLLPDEVEAPIVAKQDSDARPAMYISLSSSELSTMELDDYARRYIVDRFSVIPGVSSANVNSGSRAAMRIWLDRLAMAARGVTVADVEAALRSENIELPAGRVESEAVEFRVRLARSYETPADFRALVIANGDDGAPIRLGELAEIQVGPANTRELFSVNQQTTVGIGVSKQSNANTLQTLEAVKVEIDKVAQGLPEHMQFIASSDDSLFIREAIDSVYQTIAITVGLVSLVILIFLGNLRTMIIPAITIPVCLVSAFVALAAFGFSVNLITLLALVLSIGLVVDDAIVVLENIYRRIEKGEPPLLAAYKGARQVSFAVIATTAVIVAVFTPIMFLQDNVGVIFRELAVAICAAVIFSSVLALSLTPMMCAKLLRHAERENAFTHGLNLAFRRLESLYRKLLTLALRHSWVVVSITFATLGFAYWLATLVPAEYAPKEDQGMVMARVVASEGTGIERMRESMAQLEAPIMELLEDGSAKRLMSRVPSFGSTSPNTGFLFVTMSPWQERDVSSEAVSRQLTAAWQDVPSVRAFAFSRSGLSRGGGGQPVQFVIGGSSYDQLADWRDIIMEQAESYPGLTRMDSDLKETQPQLLVQIDRQRAAALGVSVENVGRTLAAMMSEQRVTTYLEDGEEYDVIVQAAAAQRASASDLTNIYVRSERSGELIPLANLIRTVETSGPGSLQRYNRMRAVTLSANLAPGYALEDALTFLENAVASSLPESAQVDYKGESLEFKEASGSLLFIFGMALLIVFLVLAAQFESFLQPVVILLAVPMAIAGALFGLYLNGSSLNIYSQIGMIMLIGIAAKNGVLIIEFINQLRDAGHDFLDAVVDGAVIRLRPVMMTTISTVVGALPLVFASGAGAESRNVLGVVIFSGVLCASWLTLFVVPVFYRLLAGRSTSPKAVAANLDALLAADAARSPAPGAMPPQ